MPPRLQLLSRAATVTTTAVRPAYQPVASFLYPPLSSLQQQRPASILSSLSDNRGAYNKRIRRGRGPSSGKGKTSGRGHKGQKQHGKVPAGFNGGQTPEHVVHGERGFDNAFSVEMSPINLNKIQYWISTGRLDATKPITLRELSKSRCLHGVARDGVKLLARGKEELTTPINIVVSRASAEAIKAVESVGGTVTTRFYTPFAIEKVLKGEMDPINSIQSRIALSPTTNEGAVTTADAFADGAVKYRYRLPDPSNRKDIEYYRDSVHRGYLSHLVEEGHGPSLFFKSPAMRRTRTIKNGASKGGKAASRAENRIW
ncbi:ribosomal protein L15 [Polychaeton citri CBS 116435]|uniref:Ribosomal protein L15 n=1 Tax=Polychaeton citri CBS 116435 TaxID=1314669 RepID=A0A9P4UT14_9PEZI|nr:ribosomal protein L15 [Polychaeton citri CBS 116435]